MNICVFLSAADLADRYTRPAKEFAELIGNLPPPIRRLLGRAGTPWCGAVRTSG